MGTQVVAIDPAAFFKNSQKIKQADSESDQAFAALFAQITQGMESKSSEAALKPASLQATQSYSISSSGSDGTTLSSPAGTPHSQV